MAKNVIGNPFQPIGGDGGVVGKVIKAIKALFNIFKKPAEEAGKTDSINDNSSLENIDRITQIFSDFREQVHSRAVEIEKAVSEEVNYYVEELHTILDDNAEKIKKYNIRTKVIERQIDKIAAGINGTIDDALSKSVSLDNSECKNVIKMIPGAKKEAAMSTFFTEVVKNALDVCCEEIHSSLSEIYEDVETEVIGAVDMLQGQSEKIRDSLGAVDEENYQESAKEQMVSAYYILDVLGAIDEILD